MHLSQSSQVKSFHYQIPNTFHIRENVDCVIAGYGSSHTLGKNTLQLRSGATKLISNNECGSLMSVFLPRNTVCTKNNGTAPCGGDSGGPLFCGKHLVGVVSHGPVCHQNDMPSVYAFTPRYKKWIQRVESSYKTLEGSS